MRNSRRVAWCGRLRADPVPFELLHRLCALALCAPTKSDLQQRDIVIVDDARLKQEILAPLAEGPSRAAMAQRTFRCC